MCTGVEIAIGAALIGAGTAAYSGQQQASAQKKATTQATKNAQTQAAQADREFNKANAKSPDIAGLDANNALAAKGGQGSTMLTGALGVDPSALALGKSTLLGS